MFVANPLSEKSVELGSRAVLMAQNFDTSGTGSGGVDDIVGAFSNLNTALVSIGSVVAVTAFILAVGYLLLKIKGGGSLGDAMGPILFVLLGAMLLGLGGVVVGWFMGLGNSLA